MPAELEQTPESNYDRLTIPEATTIQTELRKLLQTGPYTGPVSTIAGADISLDLHSDTVFAGIVILSYPDLTPIAYSLIKSRTAFPYVPGYLAFREIPAILKAYEQILTKPDLVMFDGNGILHARRMGIASHFGVLTDSVTMGCAKNKLAGKYQEPGAAKGDFSLVIDKGDTIGYALRSKDNVKPIFISPGHKMDLSDSLDIAMKCIGKHRLPEPTRKAHEIVNLFRTGKLHEGFHVIERMTLFG